MEVGNKSTLQQPFKQSRELPKREKRKLGRGMDLGMGGQQKGGKNGWPGISSKHGMKMAS